MVHPRGPSRKLNSPFTYSSCYSFRKPAAPACRSFRGEGASLWVFPKASPVRGNRFLDDFLREKQCSREPWRISSGKSSRAGKNDAFPLGDRPETGLPLPAEAFGQRALRCGCSPRPRRSGAAGFWMISKENNNIPASLGGFPKGNHPELVRMTLFP